jgi:hypothetical protein
VFVFVAVGLSIYYLTHEFKGLPIAQSMDAAQVGREFLRGHGWETKIARPLAMGELERHGKVVQTAIWKDTYNAPIPPMLDAAAIWLPVRMGWDTAPHQTVFADDTAIAVMGIVFFLGAVWVLYLVAAELFDKKLAAIAVGLVLVCDMMWQYALSGLPQMFLLLVLHLTIYALLRAMRAQSVNEPCLGWVAAVGAGFGVMALTHAMTIFLFVPVLVFAAFYFRRRGLAAAVMLLVFLVLYTPWLVRNAMVCGDFRGLAGFSGLDGIARGEAAHMRRFAIDLGDTSGNYYAENFRFNLTGQVNRLVEYMGWSVVAPLALVSVLHAFRRPVTAMFRWVMFAMFAGAVCGMGVMGMKEEGSLAANQFYMLFVPLFICYGMAYVLVQWDRRLGLGFIIPQWTQVRGVHYVMRRLLVIAVFAISATPLMMRLILDKNRWSIAWPPYAPPVMREMTKYLAPNELIGSDMPWAVAWYTDRRSLWLPYKPAQLAEISDYQKLGGPVAGLFLTPVSGSQNKLDDLITGEYRYWADYIVRTIDPAKSPFPARSVIQGLPQCVIYMDKDRKPLTQPASGH